MPRPLRIVIGEGTQAWDGEVDANFSIMTDSPLPLVEATSLANLTSTFPSSNYDQCLAMVAGELYLSNGTVWEPAVSPVADNVADSTATTVADMANDFNDLLSSLQGAGIMNLT